MRPAAQPPSRRMTSERLREVLDRLQAVTGRPTGDAELIKFTNNAVFRLPAAGAVARIAGSSTMAGRVGKVIRVARWLADHDVPAVRLLDGVQPVEIDGLLVTLWTEVRAAGPPPGGADLAGILRRLHRLPVPEGGLPRWAPVSDVRLRLAEPDGVDDADVRYLLGQCDELEEQIDTLRYALPPGPIHGDAFMGNLIAGASGPVICDFDSTSVGPREWDLTPLAVGRLRFDYPGDDYAGLAAAYGFDVIGWPGFATLRRLRELKLVASVVPVLGSRPVLRDQWQHRLNTYRRGDLVSRWSAYRSAA
jgi:hypothetical protein